MCGRRTTFILLNQTNEELALDRQSQSLLHCSYASDLKPPDSILAGEYGVWMLEPNTQVSHMKGSLRYNVCGGSPNEQLHIRWDNPVFRANKYDGTPPEGYETTVLGGEAARAMVAVIFSTRRSDFNCFKANSFGRKRSEI